MNLNRKWNVSKYAWWDYSKSKWRVPADLSDTSTTLMLILKGTQFLLINNKTVIESFNLIQKSKGANVFVRNGCMALVARCGEKYRKFKVLFNSGKEAEDCAGCLQKYIKTVVERPKAAEELDNNTQGHVKAPSHRAPAEQETLPEMLEQIMSKAKPSLPAPDSIPEDYPLESAVRLCILDPGFPRLVEKVEAIINNRNK